MTKKYIPYLIIFLTGALAGMWAHRQYHRTHKEVEVQRDTVIRHDTIRYSRLELVRNTYELDIPKIDNPRMVLVPADSTTIIYRDSVRYVTLPRQYFFTETKDAQIWHSGIDSTIDSLNVVRKTQEITKATQTVAKRHGLSIGVGLDYSTGLFAPVQLEYSYNVSSWLSVYGYAEYELFRKQFGIGGGMKMSVEW